MEMKKENSLTQRVQNAVKCYLEQKDYKILDTHFEDSRGTAMDIVAMDIEADCLVFATIRFVGIGEDLGEDPGKEMQSLLENCAAEWLSQHNGPATMQLRFDAIAIRDLGDNKALLRHHIGCLS